MKETKEKVRSLKHEVKSENRGEEEGGREGSGSNLEKVEEKETN